MRDREQLVREAILMATLSRATGTAVYGCDLRLPGMLVARVVHSPLPHCLVRAIHTATAKAISGVHAVLTARDIPERKLIGKMYLDQPILVMDRARTVLDSMCLIAAESEELAEQAAEALEFDLEPLPVVTSPKEALKPGAPQLHEGGNLLKHIKVRYGDVKRGFAQADVIIENEYHLPFIEHAFLETESAVAAPKGDKITVWVGSQNPYLERSQVAAALGLPEEKVEIVDMHAGGGFGGKDDGLVAIFVALLAHATGRPVRLFFDRKQSIQGHSKRHAWTIRSKWGATREGKLTAVETKMYADTGAYAHWGEPIATFVSLLSTGPYEVPNVKIDTYVVYTNNLVGAAMRAWDNQAGAFVTESQMDELAAALGIHPLKLRWLNALREGSALICGGTAPRGVGIRATLEAAAQVVGVTL